MQTAVPGAIVVDARTGRIEGANILERTALVAMRATLAILIPFDNFGFSYIARTLRAVLPSKKRVIFRLDDDSLMQVRYGDPYWSTLVSPNYGYEPSIQALLADSRDVAYGFIDGGANHGYWSILVSGQAAGSKPCVAIEAASDTFRLLDENSRLNGRRFTALDRAIGATSGERVRIYGAKHEARSAIAPSADAVPILDVDTITVDDVAAMPEFAGVEKFVVKLDVEGVEIPAFSGASRLLETDTAFVYEEHGSDRTHQVTRHVLEILKLRVFWMGEGTAKEIASIDELDRIKVFRRTGYDMVASRSPFWIGRFERFVAGRAERGPH
ncbi:FkbM family methyltransferase [Mesorhizobium sp. LHD-90]|uniref:FkbM family methyltransferase n=1 Tax=Mesorhizobium sp. LHD-90 TaxID=3071414 RepID=UPI0027DFF244|nr:FkbM family methyltransferase [Mesorhizobium sp. LHD-90]MDQ6434442.1 FkbM family methyltransferase [Mesorhizobium sp. LHD-90]